MNKYGGMIVAVVSAALLASCTSSPGSAAAPDAEPTIPLEIPTPTGAGTPAERQTGTASGQPSTPAASAAPARALDIVAPSEGADVSGLVIVEVTISGFSLTELTGHISDDMGHLYAFVDEAPPPTRVRLPAAPSIVTSADTSIELGDLEPGEHTVTVVATHAYPVPFEPRVDDVVTFTVTQ